MDFALFGLLLIVFGVVFVEYFQIEWTSENIEGRGPIPNAVRTYPFIDTGVVLIILGIVTITAGYLKSVGRIRLQRSKKELRTSKLPPNQKIRIITTLHQFRDKPVRYAHDQSLYNQTHETSHTRRGRRRKGTATTRNKQRSERESLEQRHREAASKNPSARRQRQGWQRYCLPS